MPSAASLAANTRSLPGRWVNSVLSVSQPYSLPSANTPSISAKTPPKNGNPAISVPARDSGRNCSSPTGASSGSSAYGMT